MPGICCACSKTLLFLLFLDMLVLFPQVDGDMDEQGTVLSYLLAGWYVDKK